MFETMTVSGKLSPITTALVKPTKRNLITLVYLLICSYIFTIIISGCL